MHIRVVRTKSGGKVREYPQLVESYRREDGMPAHRVVASLKDLTPLQVDNLRAALRAGRDGRRVVEQLQTNVQPARPTANLRYLDLAVLLELWRRWGMHSILEELIRNEAEVAPADVVTALVLQRCVDPGSKLYAERWFPTTALPELLAVPPEKFNNTRLHRVLEQLDRVTPALMERLSARCLQRSEGTFTSLFIDVTDTWFEGSGPDLAQRGKTKEGRLAKKIGLVLLCNEHGYPLRWKVVPGRSADNKVMHAMVSEIRKVQWARNTPLVLDRAMGTSADLALLNANQLHFLTAIRVTEYSTYAPTVPWGEIQSLQPTCEPDAKADDALMREASRRLEAVGMKRISNELFAMDLGVRELGAPIEEAPNSAQSSGRIAHTMWLTTEIARSVEVGDYVSFNAAARSRGMSPRQFKNYRTLLRLADSIQRDVLDGRAESLSLAQLYATAAFAEETAQREHFDRLLRAAPRRPIERPMPTEDAEPADEVASSDLRVRVIAYFTPNLFLQKRRSAEQRRARIEALVTKLNESQRIRAKDGRALVRQVEAQLRAESLLEVYDVRVTDSQDGEPLLDLRFDEAAWKRRRRYDGFSVLVGHESLASEAADLIRLYRAKDRVEKDFQVIKSVVKLRPVHHCTTAKVRAHVTLCILALLLERASARDLGARSLPDLIETFRSCHLNLYEQPDQTSSYLLTKLTPEQRDWLHAAHMQHLADDEQIAERVTPR